LRTRIENWKIESHFFLFSMTVACMTSSHWNIPEARPTKFNTGFHFFAPMTYHKLEHQSF
jgi:hypothetical protein